MKKTNLPSSQYLPRFFLFLALIFGGFARLYSALQSSFPLNDGALFFTMTSELVQNGFRLPEFSNYNNLHIPFAYPPLGFYIAGLLQQISGWDLMDIFRILPGVFTILSIAVFYLLAGDLTRDKFQAGLATLIFAFLPAAYDWQIMGGGVTRAPAFFFSLLALHFIFKMYTGKKKRDILLAIIFCSLTVLCHPETALHTAASVLVFFLFFGRNKRGLIHSAIVTAGVLLLSLPWWLTVILRHGFSPFTAAGKVGFSGFEWLFTLFTFDFTGEFYVQTIAVFALIGLIMLLYRKEYFLPALFLVIFLSAPRSATRSLSPIMALFAGCTLTMILEYINSHILLGTKEPLAEDPLRSRLSKIFLGILIIQWVISTFTIGNTILAKRTLTESDQKAFAWVFENTPPESRFLILTGANPLLDPVSEWFPTLSGRESIATVYGYEWKPGIDFRKTRQEFSDVQECLNQDTTCVTDWLQANDVQSNYLLVRNNHVGNNSSDALVYQSALQEALRQNSRFSLVYGTPEISIFAFTKEN